MGPEARQRIVAVWMVVNFASYASGQTQPPQLELPRFPSLLHREAPTLPSGLRPGFVVFMFVIGPNGQPTMLKALAGDMSLRPAAEKALSLWRFDRGRRATTGVVSIGVGVPKEYQPRQLSPLRQIRPTARVGAGGAVIIDAEVSDDGSISRARAVSGPSHLRGVAEEAVKQWRYPSAALPYRLAISVRVDGAV